MQTKITPNSSTYRILALKTAGMNPSHAEFVVWVTPEELDVQINGLVEAGYNSVSYCELETKTVEGQSVQYVMGAQRGTYPRQTIHAVYSAMGEKFGEWNGKTVVWMHGKTWAISDRCEE